MSPGTRVQISTADRDHLGESPSWDGENAVLTRVDITAGLLHSFSPEHGTRSRVEFGGELAAAVPRAGGGFVLAINHSLVTVGRGPDQIVATVEHDSPDTRFNDCRADAAGRLWAGTMSRERRANSAALYRLEAGGEIEPVITGTTVSNGLGWNRDATRMYFIDSPTQRIDVFDYDLGTGSISGRRSFAEIAPSAGLPDGLTVDADDCVWVCLFGGAAVRRYAPSGELDREIRLPVTNPTCPAFGGRTLETLFITSARHRLTTVQLEREPAAGALLALRPGVRGRPANKYAG